MSNHFTESISFSAPATGHLHARLRAESDWQVLVLYADDTESDIKGIWGPYTDVNLAAAALEELRQWPLDGRWDMRRLNKFVARKSGNEPDQLRMWSWQ